MPKTTREDPKGLVRTVLPMMARHGVPITPQNYAVWYAYALGNNKELQETLDAMIDNDTRFTDAQNQMLCTRFGFLKEADEIRKLRDALVNVLLNILNDISEINGETAHYESFLTNSVGLLSEEVSLDDIKNIVECIIAETKSVVEYGKTAQRKIENITSELTTLKHSFEKTRSEALRDFLTGIANRKAFDEMLEQMTDQIDAMPNGLCLLILDIDHFKKFNDQHGHIVGDEVLRFTAQQLTNLVRGNDFVARIGGEEFAILLPDTPLRGATSVSENIRAYFSSATLKTAGGDKKLGRITLSIGGASYRAGETSQAFIQRADKALYAAKAAGRDRTVIVSDRQSGSS